MLELIALIIFILSLGGILFISYKKIPVLNTLPQNGNTGFKSQEIVLRVENKIKNFFSIFEKHKLLHKFLFSVKCIVSRTETQIDHWLRNLRKKAQEKNKK